MAQALEGHMQLGDLEGRVKGALASIDAQQIVERIWKGDHTVWSDDPAEITQPNRLGWLDVARDMIVEAPELRRFAEEVAGDDFTSAVLLGMGGSSLAPEVLQKTLGTRPGMLNLHVLDTTHPDAILDLGNALDLSKTLFIVSSKSGSTIETLSQLEYFWNLTPRGQQFTAITDPGSALQRLGEERGFQRVFLNREDIGGRYSALSYFGLVPGALLGADIEGLLEHADAMAESCRTGSAGDNPGASLGAAMGEGALAGHDKLTLQLPSEIASFGDWVEQLLAESTGKEGKGILPVVGEPGEQPYGNDRFFVRLDGDKNELSEALQPVVNLPYDNPLQLGGEFFRWEFATAVACQRFQTNPFDQPNVQSAKDATSRILDAGTEEVPSMGLGDALASLEAGDYLALLAYLPRNPQTEAALQSLRRDLGQRHGVATTLGFGPRYLHSTGQLHKGGRNNGVFVVITDDAERDVGIPGRTYTFDRLRHAQALGDVESLGSMGRRVAAVHLKGERIAAIESLRSRLA